jgi:type I restriction enzyme, S subunit
VKDQIRKQTTGAAQPQLPIKTPVNFTIRVPTNLDDQSALVKKLRAFEPETQHLASLYERKLEALEALKKSLLHRPLLESFRNLPMCEHCHSEDGNARV